MADERVDLAGAGDDLRRHELRAGAVLGLRREQEARIAGEAGVVGAVVVVDPGEEAGAQRLDEGERRRGEAVAARLRGEGDVEDRHAAAEVARLGELARRGEREIEVGRVARRWRGLAWTLRTGSALPSRRATFGSGPAARNPEDQDEGESSITTVRRPGEGRARSSAILRRLRAWRPRRTPTSRSRHPRPRRPRRAPPSGAPACVLRGTYPGPKGAQIFDAQTGGRAVATFTGAIQPMVLTDLPADPTAGRGRISTTSGSASFRVDGWVAPSAVAVFTAKDVPVVAGHVWISDAQRVKLVQAAGGAVGVEIGVPGTGGQTVRATAPCDALTPPAGHAGGDGGARQRSRLPQQGGQRRALRAAGRQLHLLAEGDGGRGAALLEHGVARRLRARQGRGAPSPSTPGRARRTSIR